MFEFGFLTFICLAILGAWLLLQIEVAEVSPIVMVLVAAAVGIYWTWLGGWGNETSKGVGIFALLVVTLGFVRLGVEKLSDMLVSTLRHVGSSHTHGGP